ncbi:MAG: CDP-alcohol phosphatidyltransferase family protein [Myxococcales bacterium]|nr:CDP-alcohol phosphatidyltransferase family protein [Myxococcales bacterium]
MVEHATVEPQASAACAESDYDREFRELVARTRAAKYRPAAIARFVVEMVRAKFVDLARMPDVRRSFMRVNLGCLAGLLLYYALLSSRVPLRGFLHAAIVHAIFFALTFPLVLLNLHRLKNPPPGEGPGHDRFYSPNTVTYARLQAIPLLIVGFGDPLFAPAMRFCFVAYVALALSDSLDGILARATKRGSYFGRALDPFVDIVFHVSLASTLAINSMVPWWLAAPVILRYALPLALAFVYLVWRGGHRVDATWFGKLGAVFVGAALGLAILDAALAPDGLPAIWLRRYWIVTSAVLIANIGYILWAGMQIIHRREGVLEANP